MRTDILDNLAKIQYGFPFKSKYFSEQGKIRVIRIRDIKKPENPTFYNGDYDEEYIVNNGDIIIGMDGEFNCILWQHGQALLNQRVARIFPKKSISKNYLYYFLKMKLKEIESKITKTTVKHLLNSQLKRIEIPLHPIGEQEEIARVLTKIDCLKKKREQANQMICQIPNSLFHHMFQHLISNIASPKTPKLEELCNKITDGTHKTPKYVDSGIPFLRVTDLTKSNSSKKFISKQEHNELIKRCKPEKSDILYSKNGTIGVAKIVDWDYEFSIFVSLCLLKVKKELIRPKYLETFLNTPYALRQAKRHSKKGTITNLHLIEIKKIKVPLPSLENQDKFIEKIEKLNLIIQKQDVSTQETCRLYNSLISKAFKG